MTKELTKIELFCDDAAVGRIQRTLTQIKGVYNVKTVPVINAEAKANGKVKAVTDGSVVEQFSAHIADKRGQTFVAKDIQDWLESVGRERTAYGYLLQKAVKLRLLSKHGQATKKTYKVKL